MIVKTEKGYEVKSADGNKHLGGPYSTEEEAKFRLKQVEYFKNQRGGKKKK